MASGTLRDVMAVSERVPARAGPAVGELERAARRVSALGRAVIAVGAGLLALAGAPAGQRVPAAAAVVVLAAWSAVHLRATRDEYPGWVAVADVVVVGALCLTMRWTVAPAAFAGGTNWVLIVASITGVTAQWSARVGVGAVMTVAVAGAYLLGAGPQAAVVAPLAGWILVEAAQARGLFLLVGRGGRRTDAALAREAEGRRDAAVAAARRADEREHLAALHDTAAATLLMVGQGVVRGHAPWLSEQAARDLEVLTGGPSSTSGGEDAGERARDTVDLDQLLGEVIAQTRLPVRLTAGHVRLPAAAAEAIVRSVREALTNVERHAGVREAEVRVRGRRGGAVVEVRDRGRGFDPGAVPEGRGIAESIVGRMARAGGRGSIRSAPGLGTSVLLEWPDG